jgi:hypothetical protein
MMRQPSLFDPPQTSEPRPVNVEFIRKNLLARLRTLRQAEVMPWHPVDMEHWEKEFPRLARHLPEAERKDMVAAFSREVDRLKALAEEQAR